MSAWGNDPWGALSILGRWWGGMFRSLEMFSFCINFRAVLPGHRDQFPLAQESRGGVRGDGGSVRGGVDGLAEKEVWSHKSCDETLMDLRDFLQCLFAGIHAPGVHPSYEFWKDGKGLSTSKAFHSQLNCILTCHLDLNQIAGHKGSLKAWFVGSFKHSFAWCLHVWQGDGHR